MIMKSKIRLAAAIAILIVLPGTFRIKALQKWARGQDEPPGNPATAPASNTQPELIRATNILMQLSLDNKTAYGFSMRTGEEWGEASAPAGSTFDKSTLSVADDVGVIQAGDREFGFSPGTGKWDSAQLSKRTRVDVKVFTGIAAFQDGDRVYALGGMQGGWNSVQLPTAAKVDITIATDIAAFQDAGRIYAFSAKHGGWDSIQVPAGAKADFFVGDEWATVQYGTHTWAFSTAAGKWRGIDIGNPRQPTLFTTKINRR
jgi:hypothetical protein